MTDDRALMERAVDLAWRRQSELVPADPCTLAGEPGACHVDARAQLAHRLSF
jgi:hypothetical protein